MEFLKDNRKLVILGIGNELRGDDVVGSLVARSLTKLFSGRDEITVFDGGTVPENYTSPIKKENPSHIILIDAADMGMEPGSIKIIRKEDIAHYNLSTHAMPLSFLITYLQNQTGAGIILMGIQPKNMEIGNEVSEEISQSRKYVLNLFRNWLKKK